MALSWLSSITKGHPRPSSPSRLSPSLRNLQNQCRAVRSLMVPSPNIWLMLRTVFTALRPNLNFYNKIARISFFHF
uniref:Uncharacterized protein n=1 Tax=Heterorhabditis bacteriophora TaxID=37862 RepID=A0A1I7W798_HETBA